MTLEGDKELMDDYVWSWKETVTIYELMAGFLWPWQERETIEKLIASYVRNVEVFGSQVECEYFSLCQMVSL